MGLFFLLVIPAINNVTVTKSMAGFFSVWPSMDIHCSESERQERAGYDDVVFIIVFLTVPGRLPSTIHTDCVMAVRSLLRHLISDN